MNEKNIVKIVCDELDINQTELAKKSLFTHFCMLSFLILI